MNTTARQRNHRPDTTPRSQRNRPLRTISLSPEAWDMLDELAEDASASRSATFEKMVRAAHANFKRRSHG